MLFLFKASDGDKIVYLLHLDRNYVMKTAEVIEVNGHYGYFIYFRNFFLFIFIL